MTIEYLPQWADELAAAFRAAGPDTTERGLFGGRAYLVEGSLIGMVELKPGQQLAVRMRLDEQRRTALEARAHFDPQSSIPTLLIVTEDDRDFAISLIPHAYRFARSRESRAEPPTPAATATGPAAPRRRRSSR